MTRGPGARLRKLLLEAVRGAGAPVTDELRAFSSWQPLSVLWQTGWLGPGRSSDGKLRAEIRRRFRELGAARRPVAALAQATAGDVVCLSGRAQRWPGRTAAEAGFLLDDETADPVPVLLAEARILGGSRVRDGDGVTVLGFCDRAIDPAVSARVPRRPPWRAVVRSGDELPLIAVIESV